MAKIGLKYPVVGVYDETTGTYSKGCVLAKAIKFDSTPEANSSELYADDALAEADYSFKKGTVSLEVDDLDDEKYVLVLGHTIDEEKGVVCNEGDIAPYMGYGCYGSVMRNNVRKYRAVFYTKVKFSEPNEALETKGDSTSFKTVSLSGTCMADKNGDWKYDQTFESEEEAKTWLNGLVKIVA